MSDASRPTAIRHPPLLQETRSQVARLPDPSAARPGRAVALSFCFRRSGRGCFELLPGDWYWIMQTGRVDPVGIRSVPEIDVGLVSRVSAFARHDPVLHAIGASLDGMMAGPGAVGDQVHLVLSRPGIIALRSGAAATPILYLDPDLAEVESASRELSGLASLIGRKPAPL